MRDFHWPITMLILYKYHSERRQLTLTMNNDARGGTGNGAPSRNVDESSCESDVQAGAWS